MWVVLPYRTIHDTQYPKIDFWHAEFFLGRIHNTIPTYGLVSKYVHDVRSMFTVHTWDGTDGRSGRHFNLLILVRMIYVAVPS